MSIKSKTYKEVQSTKTYLVLTLNGVCIGVFTNLKTAVEAIRKGNNSFPSYWTLIRKKERPLVVRHENDIYMFSEHKINTLKDESKKTTN